MEAVTSVCKAQQGMGAQPGRQKLTNREQQVME